MTVLGVIGATALWLLYGWLFFSIVSSYLAGRKGYGEKLGLATTMIIPPAVIVWLLIPPKPESDWKKLGPFGRGGSEVDELIEADPKAGTPADPKAGTSGVGGPGPTGPAS